MTFGQLLSELAQHNIAITITGHSIATNTPADKIPQRIKEVLRLNKADIIATLQRPLITYDTAPTIEQAALALGGVVVGEVEQVPGEVVGERLSFDDWLKGRGVILCPGDEFGF